MRVKYELPARQPQTDLGLELLRIAAVPGVAYSQWELAAWMGCTATNVRLIERRALRKLRHRLPAELTP